MEQVGIRQLKDHLSAYVARARDGAVIEVTDHGVPVARLTPPEEDSTARLRALAKQLDNGWRGGKPAGVAPQRALRLTGDLSLADAILEDREPT